MAQASYSSNDSARVDSVRVARRQLLTTRSNTDLPPPRVVLHLPDLNAFDGVVLGPPRPVTHRRFDGPHAKAATDRQIPATAENDRDASGPIAPTLANVLRVPLGKLAPQLAGATNLERIGKLILLLQQPKMLLAAILAAGLQLAAVLAMITGNAPPGDSSPASAEGGNTQVAASGSTRAPQGESIRTPASIGFAPGSSRAVAPTGNVAGPSLVPSLPPPQTLPGASGELPDWQTPAEAGSRPTPNAVTGGSPVSTPSQSDSHGSRTATVAAAGVPAGKTTRARLVGTIKSLDDSGVAP